MTLATLAKKKQGEKAPGGPLTPEVVDRCRNPPQAAKLDGGKIKLRMLRMQPAEGSPRKMAKVKEMKFLFHLDRKRVYAARSVQASPPAVTAKYDNPDVPADQRPFGGHRKAGAPKVPAKGGPGLKIASCNKDNLNSNKIVCMGATRPAVLRASAAAKHRHGFELPRVDGDDPDDHESASAGARKPAWLQASETANELDGGVSGTPRKKARGGEVQFPVRLKRAREYAAQNTKAKPPAIATKRNKPDDRTNQRPYGGHGKAEEPKAPAEGRHGHKISSRG